MLTINDMRRAQRLLLIALIAFALHAAGAAAASFPDAFNEAKWGSRPQPGMRLAAEPSPGLAIYLAPESAKTAIVGGVKTDGSVYFYNNHKLFKGVVWFHGPGIVEVIRAAFNKQYGSPTLNEPFSGHFMWSWPRTREEIKLSYDSSTKKTVVEFTKLEDVP